MACPDRYEEETGWNSEGQTSGFRMASTEDGGKWVESWVQVVGTDGVVSGKMEGENTQGDLWTV
jgi:hypothetical protein